MNQIELNFKKIACYGELTFGVIEHGETVTKYESILIDGSTKRSRTILESSNHFESIWAIIQLILRGGEYQGISLESVSREFR